MGLVSTKEIQKASGLGKFGFLGYGVASLLSRFFGITHLNKIYNKHKHLKDQAFLDALIEELRFHFEIPEDDLKRIPKEGAFISVSNHPLGGADGILLMKILGQEREDFKIMANFLLHKVEPLKKYIFPVNPFENHKDLKSSFSGIKECLTYLKDGHPLGIFPAGEVSTFQENLNEISDIPWSESAIKLIKKANVPVIPVYFHAKNSPLFYSLSEKSDVLRTAKLPSELLKAKNRKIQIRIGKPISPKIQKEFTELEEFGQFIRKKTYMLSSAYDSDSKSKLPNLRTKKEIVEDIIAPIETALLKKELSFLKSKECLLSTTKQYELFLAEPDDIPNLLQEIGRLREVSFREIGEGTNRSIDLDKYDEYYHHLMLWDTQAEQLVGAYRMGIGQEIYKKHGINGFYVNELFDFDTEIHSMFKDTIEMGRAFVNPDFQQKPLPLFLLWKGIIHATLRYPTHKYLMGGVSISANFSNFSKSVMIEFMQSHYYDPFFAQYIHPKQAFKVRLKEEDKAFVFDQTKTDLNKFDKLIDEIEPGKLRLPVLMKKYIKQNAKVVCFNVDPNFNDCIDGLMYIRISEIPEGTVRPVIEEFEAELKNKLNNT